MIRSTQERHAAGSRPSARIGWRPSSTVAATASSERTLLDQFVPVFEFGNRHAIVVEAPAARVAAAVEAYRLDTSFLVRLLFRLRGLGPAPGTLRRSLTERGFIVLADDPGREVVLGIAGRFWALDERGSMIALRDARAFVDFSQAGAAKAAGNLRLGALGPATTLLSTETRVHCVDAVAYRRFALYWALISPFSGWIRRDMLRGMRRCALDQTVA